MRANDAFVYLVTYDLRDDSRRVQVAELLLDMGGQRLQRSVFSIAMDAAALVRFQRELGTLLDEDADRLHWYRTCGNCPGIVAHSRAAVLPEGSTEGRAWIV